MLFNRLTRKQFFAMSAFASTAILLTVLILFASWTSQANARKSNGAGCSNRKVDTTNSTLELTHIVFRHGPRTPVDTYPNDPYVNFNFAPTGWGHLTNKGKDELFKMGTWLHQRYGNFWGSYYSPDFVHSQATASPRALMSLQTVLASLFPPQDTPMDWNPDLNWQPIPIFSEPLDEDTLLLVRKPCPRYFEARNEVLESAKVLAELKQYDDLMTNLTEISGMPIDTADAVNSLYITLQAEEDFGLKLPAWTSEYYPKKMQFLTEQCYVYNGYTTEMQRIKGGPFLKKMFAEMLAKQADTLEPVNRRLFIYTGHDWTVGNILSALKVWKRQLPLFSVMTIFELHKNRETGEYYVEIFLRNNPEGCLEQLKVPKCDWKCPLNKLIELSKDVVPTLPHEVLCKAKSESFTEPPPRPVDRSQSS